MDAEQMLMLAVSALSGVSVKLWLQTNFLGRSLDELKRTLGQFEGFTHAVNACPAKGCPFRGQAPDAAFSITPTK